MKKFFVRFLVVVGTIIGIYFLLGLFAPSEYKVERNREITATPEAVFAQISTFEAWSKWSPWKRKDPTLKETIEGEDGTVGCIQKWTGDPDISGSGQIKITSIEPNKKFGYEMIFDESMVSNGSISLEETEMGTKIIWVNEGEIPFMMRTAAWLFFDMDKMMGPDFESGLKSIDSLAVITQAELDAAGTYEITEMDFPTTNYYGIRSALNIADVDSSLYASTYGQLGEFCGKNKIAPAGMPVGFGFEWNEETGTCVLMPAFPVAQASAKAVAPVELYTVNACKALVVDYYGEYDQTGQAHGELEAYVQKNGLEYVVVMEEFVTDPTTVSTMDSVLTKIYYFLKP